jgi:hypothetical protein
MFRKHTSTVSAPTVTADKHGLSIAAAATLDYAIHCLDAVPAPRLTEAWAASEPLFAAPADRFHSEQHVERIGPWPPDPPLAVDRRSPIGFADDLTVLGFTARAETVWDDTSRLTYLDDPRRLHLLTVEEPFWLWTPGTDDEPGSTTVAADDRYRIRADHYLFTEIISAAGTRTTLHGIWNCSGPVTTEGLADIDGFDAWQIDATCGSCQRRWIACAGSAWCNPDPDDVGNDLEWHFEDAAGHRYDTVDCPISGCPGRVAFTV